MGAISWMAKIASACGAIMQVGSLLGKILGLVRDFTVGLTVARLLKLITTLCSLIIMAVGGSLLALGLWKGHAMLARSLFPSLSAVSTTALPTACVAVGAAALLLGALGLLGVYREGKWLLAVYCVLVPMTGLIAYSMGGMLALQISDKVEQVARAEGVHVLQTEYGVDSKVTEEWNSAMSILSCCGMNNASDFLGGPPQACCSDGEAAPSCSVYPQGCMDALIVLVESHRSLVLGLLIAVLVALPLSALTSGLLARHLHVRDKKIRALDGDGFPAPRTAPI
ncbi:tetraspanin-1-like [Lethenteron reissneri]|uniref:tetraspanin-1-like n=1 Tax=Lethenteron reissneri TaxID=7753 RepID=UPI002AB73AE2|nr:tetraspanin-1-like [Lethenteron reissneri]